MMTQTQAITHPWTSVGFLKYDAGSLNYRAAWNGPPVILLPKFGGWIAEWRHVASGMASDHRMIALDPPGYGDSRMARAPQWIQTVTESAAAIVAALDTMGDRRLFARWLYRGSQLPHCGRNGSNGWPWSAWLAA